MDKNQDERLRKWRLILGKHADPEQEISLDSTEGTSQEQDIANSSSPSVSDKGIDEVLEALYDQKRKGQLGSSSPNINRWLGDIRKYFPTSVVQLMQRDALDRLGLDQMLLESELLESVEPDVHLVATILSLKEIMPDKTKETAREVVRKVVEELEKKLTNPIREAVTGSLQRSVRNRRPKINEINWHRTIQANLKHYQEDLKTIIPEQLIGYGRKGNSLKSVILLVDQSGSMASSVVYASVCGAILATLRSIKTHFIVFDTAVVDLTEQLSDPVDLLFGAQLGGGTDINKALTYAQNLIVSPTDTIVVLISDLFEGQKVEYMIQRAAALKQAGAQLISLLALDDKGRPSYDKDVAAKLKALDIPSFACTPDKFPDLVAVALKGENVEQAIL